MCWGYRCLDGLQISLGLRGEAWTTCATELCMIHVCVDASCVSGLYRMYDVDVMCGVNMHVAGSSVGSTSCSCVNQYSAKRCYTRMSLTHEHATSCSCSCLHAVPPRSILTTSLLGSLFALCNLSPSLPLQLATFIAYSFFRTFLFSVMFRYVASASASQHISITPQHIISHHIISHDITSQHISIISHHITSHRIISHHII